MQAKLAKWCKRPTTNKPTFQVSDNSPSFPGAKQYYSEYSQELYIPKSADNAGSENLIEGINPLPLKRIKSSYNLFKLYNDENKESEDSFHFNIHKNKKYYNTNLKLSDVKLSIQNIKIFE